MMVFDLSFYFCLRGDYHISEGNEDIYYILWWNMFFMLKIF